MSKYTTLRTVAINKAKSMKGFSFLRQVFLNDLTEAVDSSDEHVLTKDTITGDVVFKSVGVGPDSVRIITDTGPELTTDWTIVCDKVTAMTLNLLAATGSGRKLYIVNANTGVVTVDGASTDTISGELTQDINQYECIHIQDYISGKWIIL